MSAIPALLIIVLPVFLVVGCGYVLVRARVFPADGVDLLVKFATGFAVPVLLFRAMYQLDLGVIAAWQHYASFYGAALASFALGIVLARLIWKRRPGEAVAVGFCALFSNSVLLGLPIMERAYGAGALAQMYALLAVHTPICYFVGILSMEFSRRDGAPVHLALRRTIEAMFKNALTIGLALGLLLNVAGVVLPLPVLAAVDMISNAALPVALFGLGGVLTRYALRGDFSEAITVSLISILVHPALAWLLSAHVFGMGEQFVRAAVVMAAMPTGLNGYIFAALYGRAVRTSASTVLIATVLSLLSIPFWLAVLGSALLG